MRPTILHAVVLLALSAQPTHAQTPSASADPFAAGRWHLEIESVAALEAWNYNGSHEELYGLAGGVTYGVREGLVLRAAQRFAYVSQRSQDAVLLGLTIGMRGRVYRRGRVSAFLQGDVGVSHSAIAVPPHGTRFNYLAAAGAGMTARLRSRLHFVATLQVIHVSNAGLKGVGRNPDIEAVGPSIGIIVGF
jgi:hypothetical protein